MNISVNGKSLSVQSDTTVAQLLLQLDLSHERIAVEHNLKIIPKTYFANVLLEEGDSLEIVRFVGGG